MYSLLWALVGLAILAYLLFNSNDYHLFIRPGVSGHGHGYLYYDNGTWTRRIRIGSDPEIDLRFADLSPAVTKIAFKQSSFLYIYDLHANQLSQLNSEPLYPSESTTIRWSPDGRRIGFPCSHEYNGPLEVCAWDTASGELQVFSNLHPMYGNFDYLSFAGWSSDGKTVALTIFYPEDDFGHQHWLILTLNTNTGNLSTVLDSQQVGLDAYIDAALSPDGGQILFTESPSHTLYRVNADGSRFQPLLVSERTAYVQPVWSPAGDSFYVNTITYVRTINGAHFGIFLPMRYNLSGRLTGILPFQIGREIVAWQSGK